MRLTTTITAILLTLAGCNQPPTTAEANTAPATQDADAQAQANAIIAEAQAKADTILAEAQAIKTQALQERAKDEITWLHNRALQLTAQMEAEGKTELMLARFKVDSASIYLNPDDTPEFQITVTNNTEMAVSSARFHAIFKAPFREVPFAEFNFNYDIPGGLEPGESAEWKFDAYRFIPRNEYPDDREGLEFTVQPYRIDDAHGDPILDHTHAAATQLEFERVSTRLAELGKILPGYQPPPPPAEPEPLPEIEDTPAITAQAEITGNVYAHQDIYHIDRDCETMNGAIPAVLKAENARKRRMQPCPTCTGR